MKPSSESARKKYGVRILFRLCVFFAHLYVSNLIVAITMRFIYFVGIYFHILVVAEN